MPPVASPEAPSCLAVMRRALQPRRRTLVAYSVDLRSMRGNHPFGRNVPPAARTPSDSLRICAGMVHFQVPGIEEHELDARADNWQTGSGFLRMHGGAAVCSIELERRCAMSSISHPPAAAAQEQSWISLLRLREVWASLAITAMWIAVAVTAVWGSDFVGYEQRRQQHDHSVRDLRRAVRDHRHLGARKVRPRQST